MSIQWLAEVPDSTSDSGLNSRISVDAAGNVHLAYVVNTKLRYGIGSPGQLFLGGLTAGGPVVSQAYNWTFHEDVVPVPSSAEEDFWFDLAVDSKGRAHLCYLGVHGLYNSVGNLLHAAWDGLKFVPEQVQDSTFPRALAMAIAGDDSIHIAFSDTNGLRYATRARDSDPFQLVDIDNYSDIFNLSIAVGSGGNTGISYLLPSMGANAVGFQLIYAEKMPAGWVKDTADPALSNIGSGLGTNSLVIDANGVPHIAYYSGGLGIRHGTWTSAGRGSWAFSGSGESVDQAGGAAPAKILLDRSNILHIAYQAWVQPGRDELRFATRAAGLGWATVAVDPSINTGSISAGMNPTTGQAHIAYGSALFANGLHTWAVDLLLRPLPWGRRKIKILRRPS